ncbi:MAG TPA: precorrin-6A reductase [Candidatus Blautia pullicola]|uniref:Precorrin-6A reductase n=1 Tax=Candidatus Blautia pullicola TaxID=2838498 RepID=A0A9D2FSH1_9FIRM|nr:precorrin-6A reductase [Candidatus Blautia pullicola]
MCKVIVFGGTTEGRHLAKFLEKRKIPAHICVATAYGEELLPEGEGLEISHNPLGLEEMKTLFLEKGPQMVIDATHPYAAQVTENIRQACRETKAPYVRVLREGGEEKAGEGWLFAKNVEEAVEILKDTQGNILVTTGSKEAEKFTALPGYEERVFLRVLSLPKVVEQCGKLGFQGRNLICMQGPFSKELNKAMIEQYACKYLVTKMSGATGGFQEKIEAAQECGCIPVVIGRPLQEEGMSLSQCKRLLCQAFGLKSQAEISLVGIGMGSRESMTGQAVRAIDEAQLLIGAGRMVEACKRPGQEVYQAYDSQEIAAYIREHPEYDKIAVALSGDVGFFSGARKLKDAIQGKVTLVCGVSSVAYFFSCLGKPWEDVLITSVHGRETDLVSLIRHNPKVFSILGTRDGIRKLAGKLLDLGLEEVKIYTGERLSYENQIIRTGCPKDFLEYDADSLSVIYVENKSYEKLPAVHGIRDSEFLRDKVPMTKEEVRTVSLSKLGLWEDSVCYDVGAGTGSVSVEMALRACKGRVYAIEKKPEAGELIKKNKRKFGTQNLSIIEGMAPEALKELEPPTHVFMGGSSGNMKAILETVLEKNPQVRIVINCIALESISQALDCMKTLPVEDVEVIQLAVSRGKLLGPYHMMMGENPIYILSCRGRKERN